MKTNLGFNLIELIITLAISSIIITLLLGAYSSLYRSVYFNNHKTFLHQDLRFALAYIRHDLENAGVFAGISFHNQNPGTILDLIGDCSHDWCRYDKLTVGVKSYNNTTEISDIGVHASSGSDILRVQFAGAKVAYYRATKSYVQSYPNSTLSLDFYVPPQNATTAISYMLTSSNHAYLINLATPQTNDSLLVKLPVKSAINGILFDPDQETMAFMPFQTKYYFINKDGANGEAGLYVKSYDGTKLTKAKLLAKGVTDLKLRYQIALSNGLNHILDDTFPTNTTYSWCTTAEMGHGDCQWLNIIGVTVTLSIDSISPSNAKNISLAQMRESITVSWLW